MMHWLTSDPALLLIRAGHHVIRSDPLKTHHLHGDHAAFCLRSASFLQVIKTRAGFRFNNSKVFWSLRKKKIDVLFYTLLVLVFKIQKALELEKELELDAALFAMCQIT